MKYFVVSDVHGFFDKLIEALDKAGFDPTNPNHTLISCGDHFDRGRQPVEVMEYLLNLPRKVLVRGNHEELLEKVCERGFFFNTDIYNGTYDTVFDLTKEHAKRYKKENHRTIGLKERCTAALDTAKPFLDAMVPYFETKNYVFVHAWVPITEDKYMPFESKDRYTHHPNWRCASEEEWKSAGWLNPFDMAGRGLQIEKTIVCGHWHASAGWAASEGRSEFGSDACFEPFRGNGFIAIDACTAHSGKVNVLIVEDEPLSEDSECTCV